MSASVLDDGVVYQTYQTGWRGLEFLMGYYPILDRAPKGRDEDDGFQLWIRRHDEYEPKRTGATKLVESSVWRLRMADLRVIYSIDDPDRVVIVLRVARRSESTYRRRH